jgi:hypothetical protein
MAPFSKKKNRVQRHWTEKRNDGKISNGSNIPKSCLQASAVQSRGLLILYGTNDPSRHGPFSSSWMPTLPTEFELLWRNANCSRHVFIFCNWNSKTLLETWMATVIAVVLYHSLTHLLTQSQ